MVVNLKGFCNKNKSQKKIIIHKDYPKLRFRYDPVCLISHTSKAQAALDIVRQGRISTHEITDIRNNEPLRSKKIQGIWLTPNDYGSSVPNNYGNISFCFGKDSLLRDKKIYWVENAYKDKYQKTKSYVYLITNKEYEEILTTDLDTALWYDQDELEKREGQSIQFIYDEHIELNVCSRIEIVKGKEKDKVIKIGKKAETLYEDIFAGIIFITGLITMEGLDESIVRKIHLHSLTVVCERLYPLLAKYAALFTEDANAPENYDIILNNFFTSFHTDDVVLNNKDNLSVRSRKQILISAYSRLRQLFGDLLNDSTETFDYWLGKVS